jgi:multidrug transporter EmrE-like cation transporter
LGGRHEPNRRCTNEFVTTYFLNLSKTFQHQLARAWLSIVGYAISWFAMALAGDDHPGNTRK